MDKAKKMVKIEGKDATPVLIENETLDELHIIKRKIHSKSISGVISKLVQEYGKVFKQNKS